MNGSLAGILTLLLLGAIAGNGAPLGAQARDSSATGRQATPRPLAGTNLRALSSLDVWLVERFRGAQLLPDSAAGRTGDMTDGAPARVESARAGGSSDTLYALHFAAGPASGALARGHTVRLAGPTGTLAPISGTVLARRAFRAPKVPQANGNLAGGGAADLANWRYGWAYVVTLPKAGRVTPPATFRGWLLLDGGVPK